MDDIVRVPSTCDVEIVSATADLLAPDTPTNFCDAADITDAENAGERVNDKLATPAREGGMVDHPRDDVVSGDIENGLAMRQAEANAARKGIAERYAAITEASSNKDL
eukprot:TRINITY_DN3240_c0_g1_i2.p2 TRINITY_DN3240_c0_g1~~TRINITY_DN3240_c0_g1_i2.p2  ORF type:complete len:108 (-),score=29.50 TRINITY_DN3240_c0_g1_i2:43-366(-)